MHTLLRSYHGRKHHKALALVKLKYLFYDRIHRLLSYLLAAYGTVRNTDSRVKKPQVIVDLCHRSYRRARVL